jgi:hypothetical protein
MNDNSMILTVENAPDVLLVRNIENPEWGTFRFNYNAQRLTEGYYSTIGSGSNSRILPQNEYSHWEVESFRAPSDEEIRRGHALAHLAELITVTAREMVTFKRKYESSPVKLCLNGEVLEEFSICGDSPRAALFDAMEAVIRHKGRML